MKDEKAIDWRERIPQLPLEKKNKFKGSWEALGVGEEFLFCCFGRGGE
jgi:hypothetical protein